MTHETRNRLIAILVMLGAVVASGLLNPMITASVGAHQLSYTDRAEDGDPPQVALGIAMGAFRGVFVNVLWLRANQLKEEGKFHEAIELSSAITRLQPRFPHVWVFHAWNMAYNISVTTQTPQERYQWVTAGIRLLRDEGLPANPNSMLLHKELAWIYIHKIQGYTDDANQYYKREFATEWTEVMGEPPRPTTPEQRTREGMIRLYVERWLDPIVHAPDARSTLRERNPVAGDLFDAFEDINGSAHPMDFLTHWERHYHIRTYRGGWSSFRFGPKSRGFMALLDDPQWTDAWDDLVAHCRRRVLIDTYHMEPLRMKRVTEKYGPADWRLPQSHSLYWAARGVEVGRVVVDERNSETVDFVNAYRVVMQSCQELTRYGDLYFNFLDYSEGRPAVYQPMFNPNFAEGYRIGLDEGHDAVGIFGAAQRATRAFSAGYENLLKQIVFYYYRRGDIDEANRWYSRARDFDGQNAGAAWRIEDFSRTLDEFVEAELYERWDSPHIATSQIVASLRQAFYEGLLSDSQASRETYETQMRFASDAHRYYLEKQYRPMIADGGDARMQFFQTDFRMLAGSVFASVIASVGLDESQRMFFNAEPWLQRFVYDNLIRRFRAATDDIGTDEVARDFRGRDLSEVFPEPPGMASFRLRLQQELDRQRARENQGTQRK